jgi:hypothetical protein
LRSHSAGLTRRRSRQPIFVETALPE